MFRKRDWGGGQGLALAPLIFCSSRSIYMCNLGCLIDGRFEVEVLWCPQLFNQIAQQLNKHTEHKE